MSRYFFIYKPFGMISQFTRESDKPVLADLLFRFPTDVYPVGRLDADSEGLLLLTNDKSVNSSLLDPARKHLRSYLVQVEGEITNEACEKMERGLEISTDGKMYKTLPCQVRRLEEIPVLPERNPPVRFRKSIPTSWIRIELHEGKNRQVRKMTAAVGFPTLRLVRIAIEKMELGEMLPGDVRESSRSEVYSLLNLNASKKRN